jgi:hypothetical protein
LILDSARADAAARDRPDGERRENVAHLPEKRRNVLFRVLSRLAGALALVLILGGFILDATDTEGNVEPVTLLLVGIYVLGVQIYFLLEYFVETGGIE